jgi:putative two-component system response regulator
VSKILIADDDQQILAVLKELLELEGHLILLARDGEEAVAKALADPPDLVLMDVHMPKMSGCDAVGVLKMSPATALVPIVLITGSATRDDRVAALKAGCDDFLSKPIDAEELVVRTKSLLRLKRLTDELDRTESVLLGYSAALEAKDAYTYGHSERVSANASLLGAELGAAVGLGPEECSLLLRAGLLHDLGKIGISQNILHKAGRLTQAEYAEVKRHPQLGVDICKPVRSMASLIPLIAGHHEKLDGSGYPKGLKGEEISLMVRCLSIVDVYDALTSVRPYRDPLNQSQALEILEREVTLGWWDGPVLDAFIQVLATKAGIQS